MSIVLALCAAVANGVSNVLQRKANREQPPDLTFRLQLVANLVRRPVWLAGILAVIASFLLIATALRFGTLAAVEPVIVLELPVTVLLAAAVFHVRLHKREWLSIAAMTAGLAGLIACLAPSGGTHGNAGALAWAVGTATTLCAVAALVAWARKASPARKPALLGAASGIAFGLTAAFMKGMTVGLGMGAGGVFVRWQTYAMVIAGLGSMYLVQHALHAGRLVASQPGITLADPLVAILWGALVFDERVRQSAIFLVMAAAFALVMAGAAIALARSPLLQGEGATTEGGGEPPAPAHTAGDPAQARNGSRSRMVNSARN